MKKSVFKRMIYLFPVFFLVVLACSSQYKYRVASAFSKTPHIVEKISAPDGYTLLGGITVSRSLNKVFASASYKRSGRVVAINGAENKIYEFLSLNGVNIGDGNSTVYADDSSGNLYVAVYYGKDKSAVSVINIPEMTEIERREGDGYYNGLALGTGVSKYHVLDDNGYVHVYDKAANKKISTIKLPKGTTSPSDMKINNRTDQLYVKEFQDIVQVDGLTDKIIRSYDLPGHVYTFCLDEIENSIYVLYKGKIAKVDVKTGKTLWSRGYGGIGIDMGYNPATGHLFVLDQKDGKADVFIGSDGNFVKGLDTGSMPRGIAVNPDTNYVYVVNVGSRTVTVIKDE